LTEETEKATAERVLWARILEGSMELGTCVGWGPRRRTRQRLPDGQGEVGRGGDLSSEEELLYSGGASMSTLLSRMGEEEGGVATAGGVGIESSSSESLSKGRAETPEKSGRVEWGKISWLGQMARREGNTDLSNKACLTSTRDMFSSLNIL
jgi:hypothetical protein